MYRLSIDVDFLSKLFIFEVVASILSSLSNLNTFQIITPTKNKFKVIVFLPYSILENIIKILADILSEKKNCSTFYELEHLFLIHTVVREFLIIDLD